MIVSGAFNLLFRPGLRRDFRDSWAQFPPEYPQFLRTGNMDSPEMRATIMTGLNRLYERGDGEPIIYDDPKMGPQIVGVDKEFAGGFIITKRTVEDDQYGKANQGARWLAHAGRLTYEYRAAALLDDAFTGNFFKTIDGLPLIHTAHTLLNSPATVANRPATDVDFSIAGVNAIFDLYTSMRDENGDPIPMFPDTLILGTAAGDMNTYLAVWNSQLEPFSANNTDNVVRRRLPNPKVVISHYKANPKSYFFVDSRLNDAWFLIRRKITFDDTMDFDTDAAKYKATTRFMIWVPTWHGWAGANPT
jgi:hypothetical protein